MPISIKQLFNEIKTISAKMDEEPVEALSEALTTFIADWGNINDPVDERRATLLHWAAGVGKAKVVAALLAAPGVDVNAKTTHGSTPLHLAAYRGHAEVVSALLAKGVNVNAIEKDGSTPLHFAAEYGHAEVVSALLAAEGVNVNAVDEDRSTPLHLAAYNGNAETVATLIADSRVDVNAETTDGKTTLHFAIQEDYEDVVATLLRAPNINVHQVVESGGIAIAMQGGLVELEGQERLRGLLRLSLLAGKIESLPLTEGQRPFQYPILPETPPRVVELLKVIAPRIETPELSDNASMRVLMLQNLRGNLLKAFGGGDEADLATTLNANRVIATLLEDDNLGSVNRFNREMRLDKADFGVGQLPQILRESVSSFIFPVEFPYLKKEEQEAAAREIIKVLNSSRQIPVAEGPAAADLPSSNVSAASIGSTAAHVGGRD